MKTTKKSGRKRKDYTNPKTGKGSVYVCPRSRTGSTNLRTQMHRIIKKAKLTPWQRTFQNMRSTRETELAEHFPMHVVTKWIGNTDSVAVQHYLQVTNDHFTKVADGQFDSDGFDIDVDAIFEEAAQNQAQSARDSQEPETTGDDTKKAQASDESDACASSRAGPSGDGNPLVPPRGSEPPSNSSGKSKVSLKGGAKSGAPGAALPPKAAGADPRRGTNWKNLPPELKKLISTLLRPYKRTG